VQTHVQVEAHETTAKVYMDVSIRLIDVSPLSIHTGSGAPRRDAVNSTLWCGSPWWYS
jgi:hypothetical protein